MEDRAPEFVGEHRERLRLSETRDQARVELLRPRVVAQEENGGLREGPLEVDVALLAAGSAREFAGGFASRGHEPGVGGELLDGVEAIEVGDFVEDRHGEDLADPGHGAQAIEGGEVVALGTGDELTLEIGLGFGHLEVGEQLGAEADEVEAAAQEIAGGAIAKRRQRGEESFGSAREIAVHRRLAFAVEDAANHRPRVKIDAAAEIVSPGVQSHAVPPLEGLLAILKATAWVAPKEACMSFKSLERTRGAPAVRLRRFGIVARRSAPDPLGDQGTSGGSPEFLRKGRG